MNKNLPASLIFGLFLALASCDGGKKSAASIAQEWCDLNGKAHRAQGADKESAKAALDRFENEMEEKYKGDEGMMKEIQKEVQKCEAASEGR